MDSGDIFTFNLKNNNTAVCIHVITFNYNLQGFWDELKRGLHVPYDYTTFVRRNVIIAILTSIKELLENKCLKLYA